MQTVESFIAKHDIQVTSVSSILMNPNIDPSDWDDRGASHWLVTFWIDSPGGGRTLEIPFTQGSAFAEPPTGEDVLDCLASDASGYEDTTFEEWASEYGFDADSRKAEKTYHVIGEQSKKLKRFLGKQLYHSLVHGTERL